MTSTVESPDISIATSSASIPESPPAYETLTISKSLSSTTHRPQQDCDIGICHDSLQIADQPLKDEQTSPFAVPVTPYSGRRRRHLEEELHSDDPLQIITREELLRTPRKRSIKDVSSMTTSSSLRVSSSPGRCSPSKRGSPFSSSSPTRNAGGQEVLRPRADSIRPARSRCRTSSGTTAIIESFASATMQCNSDYNGDTAMSERSRAMSQNKGTTKDENSHLSFGVSTYQVVKMGWSRYTPLLTPQWLLSESQKEVSPSSKPRALSQAESTPRGHRRSKASEVLAQESVSHLLLQARHSATSATVLHSPPLTAKEDVTQLEPLVDASEGFSVSSFGLGPAFAEQVRASFRAKPSTGSVRRPAAARVKRGRSIQSCQSTHETPQSPTARVTLFPKRGRKLPFSSLSTYGTGQPRVSNLKDTTLYSFQCHPLSPEGLGIVCVKEVDPKASESAPLSPLSPLSERKGSFDSVASSINGYQSPTSSIENTLPSIVVTPPAALSIQRLQEREQQVHREGIRLEYFETSLNSSSPDVVESPLQATNLVTSSPTSDKLKTFSIPVLDTQASKPLGPPFLVSEAAIDLRNQEDESGLATFKVAVDAILSEYFVYRTVARTWKLAHQMVQLLHGILDPERKSTLLSGKVNKRQSSPVPWSQDLPRIVIPSLCCQRWIGVGVDATQVTPEWAAYKLQTMMKVVMEHIVTGMIALVTDDRAPYETPAALAHLCLCLRDELPSLIKIHYGDALPSEKKPAPDSPVTSWVRACASAESPDSDISQPLQDSSSCTREDEWRSILEGVHPSKIFMTALYNSIHSTYEKGEAIRSKANLLAVPPPRKGSRKRWQAANAEMLALKAAREKEISQVTCGFISVPEYRRRERKRAAIGHVKDNFAAFFFVRFIGELYNSRVIEVTIIRQWLQRFIFNTVFPGVPSSYELEAGCALLITVGSMLDEDAGTFTPQMKRTGLFSGADDLRASGEDIMKPDLDEKTVISNPGSSGISEKLATLFSAQANRNDDVPSNHWILVSPRAVREMHGSCSSHDILIRDVPILEKNKDESLLNTKTIAHRTITATMARLKEILAIREVHAEGRVWCREVMALRNRFWAQCDTESNNKVATIRRLKRDLWKS